MAEVAQVAARHQSFLNEGGGRHNWRFIKAGRANYPVPAHNGRRSVIAWVYIKGLCRNHDIPLDEFKRG